MRFLSSKTERNTILRLLFAVVLLAAGRELISQTNIAITSTLQASNVHRLGVNLADQTSYDSGQMLKNLIFQNPGFEPMKYRSFVWCGSVTANTCTDTNHYSKQASDYWDGGTYQVITGAQTGVSGTIKSSKANASTCDKCGQIITFDKNVGLAVNDYVVLSKAFPGSGDAGWWDSTSGGGTISTETNDLSPNTVGSQALLLNATNNSKATAGVAQYFDSAAGLSFIQLNGNFQVTFRAKGVGGNNQLNVNVTRLLKGGNPPYLNQTLTLGNSWKDYTLTFSANESGSALGAMQLVFTATGAAVELDDVGLQQTNSDPSNTTPWRDDVVNALKDLQPGTIRMMAGDALGSDLPNQLALPYARYRMGFSTSQSSMNAVAYGIHELLQLCQAVNADPWITIPTATTPSEMSALIHYMVGNGSDPYSASRIARGQSAPWTSVFNKIHIEFGNETWNGLFAGEALTQPPSYINVANKIFGAARNTSGYDASKFDLILDGWSAVPSYNKNLLAANTAADSFDIAPYLLYSANDEPMSTMYGALMAEPEVFDSPGGQVYQNVQVAQAAARPAAVSVYETNLSPIKGSITQAELDELVPSLGGGIASTEHMMQMQRIGVQYQNAFALPQYAYGRSDGKSVKLWGIVVDMGTTNRRRPQFMTQALANSVIAGNMMQTVQTGTNPTWNQPLSSDNVQINGAHYIQSFAYVNGSRVSAVVFNLSQTTSYPVTFTGPNAPSGTVEMTRITSNSINDNNETSSAISPTSQTFSSFNASTPMSLPPFSMTVLTWGSLQTQMPVFSLSGGSYTSAQSVAITDATPGAVIRYTTDGSTPNNSSPFYSSPIQVSGAGSMTIKATAAVAGFSASGVTSATYTITYPATAPVIQLASGTYTSAQSVKITDSTANAVIYYTTNGTAPTTSSTLYTGPITVSNAGSETIKAIATAPGYSASTSVSASYTITYPGNAPVISLASGTYTTSQSVTITDATPGASIYYTTNGNTPTASSNHYTGPISITSNVTIKAVAYASSYSASGIASATYVIAPYVATPVLSVKSGTYTTVQQMIVTDATGGATIYYTTDGSTPTTSSSKYSAASYIVLSKSQTVKVMAVHSGYSNSPVATGVYTITLPTAAPTFSVLPGTYWNAQSLTIKDATSGSTIYYTTDGSAPTTNSKQYTGAISLTQASITVKAAAIAPAYSLSPVTSVAYKIVLPAAAPTYSVPAGTYGNTQTVVLSSSTPGATIYYSTNGYAASTGSTKYTGPISVASTETIKAIATANGYQQSPMSSSAYTITTPVPTPTFSVKGGSYSSVQYVVISDSMSAATIYYTTDGSMPTTSSMKYTGSSVQLGGTTTLKAIAVASAHANSAVATAVYNITVTATAAPQFSVKPGAYTSPVTVALSTATKGANIFFTTNGSNPTTSSTKYTAAIKLSENVTLKAIAAAANLKPSPVVTGAYEITLSSNAPEFSVKSGTYGEPQKVAITFPAAGAIICLTTNGSTPTIKSTRYNKPVTVSTTETLKAIAFVPGHAASKVATASYTISTAADAPSFSVKAGDYTQAQTVTITDSTKNAVIYFTTNGTTPTSKSTRYTAPVKVAASETLKAIAELSGHPSSAITTAAYKITLATAVPEFSIKSGTYAGEQTVAISDSTKGAKIYYTTNGSVPTVKSTLYVKPINVTGDATLKAVAIDAGLPESAVATATYKITLAAAAPLISQATGTHKGPLTVTMQDATPGATIYYTTNGSKPTAASTRYTGAILVNKTEIITAIAIAPKLANSESISRTYTIE